MKHESPVNFNGRFIINDDFVFTSERREIIQGSSGKVVMLQTPASRCLILLLRNHGQIITQSSLIEFSWGAKIAPTITNNAFYQTISYLRRALKDIGCPDIVTTVPRMGLTINSSVKVSTLDGDVKIMVGEGSLETAPSEPISKSVAPAQVKTPHKVNMNQISLMVGTAIFIIFSIILLPKKIQQSPFQTYQTSGLGKCVVHYTGDLTKAGLKPTLEKNNIPCESNNIIFATITKQRDSYIDCKIYDKNSQKCDLILIVKG